MTKTALSTEIQLAVFDLDGTLIKTGENLVHPTVREAIRKATDHGAIITIATGRSFSFTRLIASSLGLRAPLICYQGAVIQTMDGKVLRNQTFTGTVLEPALELARRRRWQHYLEGDSLLYLEENQLYDAHLFEIHPQPARRVPDLTDARIKANQFSIFLPDRTATDHITELEQVLGSSAIVMRTESHFINVIPSGVSKGGAVAWLARSLNIPQPAVMAVGDSYNDVSMIEWAGIGVAMGNAQPAVTNAADWIAPSLSEHGAAAALMRFVLKCN